MAKREGLIERVPWFRKGFEKVMRIVEPAASGIGFGQVQIGATSDPFQGLGNEVRGEVPGCTVRKWHQCPFK